MTLIEQEFVIKKCEEDCVHLYKKLNKNERYYRDHEYYPEEEREIDLNRYEELKKMLPKLRAAFHRNLERAYEEMINDKK